MVVVKELEDLSSEENNSSNLDDENYKDDGVFSFECGVLLDNGKLNGEEFMVVIFKLLFEMVVNGF